MEVAVKSVFLEREDMTNVGPGPNATPYRLLDGDAINAVIGASQSGSRRYHHPRSRESGANALVSARSRLLVGPSATFLP